METPHRLKIKIGPHEFEAEGTREDVQQQFDAFKELLSSMPASVPAEPESPLRREPEQAGREAKPIQNELSKIMRVDGRVVSLTVRPEGIYEGILLILYGQKILRDNDSVSGAEIMDGLTSTGGFSVKRVDGYLEYLAKGGDVIVIGERRAKRYRLTNAGFARADELAEAAIKIVP